MVWCAVGCCGLLWGAAVTWAAIEPELEPTTVDLVREPLDPGREAIGVALQPYNAIGQLY